MIGLLRRNAVFIYLSFVVTGLTTVAPQRLFGEAAPEMAQEWVAGALLVGTIASMAGVALAARNNLSRRPSLTAGPLIFVMTGALLWSFDARTVLLIAALQVAARFLANYVKQDLDYRAVAIAGNEERVANDRVAVMMRFIGMLLGPLWFGAFQLSSSIMLATVFVMMLVSLSSVVGLKETPVAAALPSGPRAAPLNVAERLFIAVGIGIYATYYLLASNIVYMLSRLHDAGRASTLAGVLITIVYGTAMAATMVSLHWKRERLSLLWMAPAPVLMAAIGAAFNSSLAAVLSAYFVSAIALGVAFALYLLAVRNHVTMQKRAQDPRWLSFFNNLANTSALVAFSIMAVLVAASRLFEASYAVLLASGLSGLALTTIAGAVICQRQLNSPILAKAEFKA